ncbi:hypothetical protein WS61_05345 [Burkholderia sp. ABCPW 11]|nr:hypothetical protein WS61_05345 [Burkholderia sp. ABCPW 11]
MSQRVGAASAVSGFNCACMHKSTVFQNDASLRAAQYQIEVLLDQKHSELRSTTKRRNDVTDQLNKIWLHAVRGFVQ